MAFSLFSWMSKSLMAFILPRLSARPTKRGQRLIPLPGPLPLAGNKDRGACPPDPPLRPQRVRLTLPDSFSRAHARRTSHKNGTLARRVQTRKIQLQQHSRSLRNPDSPTVKDLDKFSPRTRQVPGLTCVVRLPFVSRCLYQVAFEIPSASHGRVAVRGAGRANNGASRSMIFSTAVWLRPNTRAT